MRCHSRDTSGKKIGKRSEIRHGRCLTAVERVLDRFTPAARREINEVGHIGGGNAKTESWAFKRRTIEKLRICPDRRHGCHLIDNDMGWKLAAQYGQQRDCRIVSSATQFRLTAESKEIEAGVGRR